MVGHFSTPITPESGSFLHADSHTTFVPKLCPNTGHNDLCVTTHLPVGDAQENT